MKTFIKFILPFGLITSTFASNPFFNEEEFIPRTVPVLSAADQAWVSQTAAYSSTIQDFVLSQFTTSPAPQPTAGFFSLNPMQQWGAMQAVDMLNEMRRPPAPFSSAKVKTEGLRIENLGEDETKISNEPIEALKLNKNKDAPLAAPLHFANQKEMDEFLDKNLEDFFPSS